MASSAGMFHSPTIAAKLFSFLVFLICGLLFSLTDAYISQCLAAPFNVLELTDSLSSFFGPRIASCSFLALIVFSPF